MSSKYAQYMKERGDVDTYEDEKGFFTYKVVGENFEVLELFVVPEHRRIGTGNEYSNKIDELAKENECNATYCTVCLMANGCDISAKYIMNNGYTIIKVDDEFIYYKKEL